MGKMANPWFPSHDSVHRKVSATEELQYSVETNSEELCELWSGKKAKNHEGNKQIALQSSVVLHLTENHQQITFRSLSL